MAKISDLVDLAIAKHKAINGNRQSTLPNALFDLPARSVVALLPSGDIVDIREETYGGASEYWHRATMLPVIFGLSASADILPDMQMTREVYKRQMIINNQGYPVVVYIQHN